MFSTLMKMLVFSCIALFGLRGALPDVLNNYSPITVFLFALIIIPVAATAVYEIAAKILKNHRFDIRIGHKHA